MTDPVAEVPGQIELDLGGPVLEGEIVEVYGPPDGWPYLDATVMTNNNCQLNTLVANMLEIPNVLGDVWAQHLALSFTGQVWHRNGLWHELVVVGGERVATYSAGTLKDLMTAVNDKHGWE